MSKAGTRLLPALAGTGVLFALAGTRLLPALAGTRLLPALAGRECSVARGTAGRAHQNPQRVLACRASRCGPGCRRHRRRRARRR
jgi:hypothetical protein